MTELEAIEELLAIAGMEKSPHDYSRNRQFSLILNILRKCRINMSFAKLSDAEIREVILLFFRIVEMPSNLTGLWHAQPCIRYMLRCAFGVLRNDQPMSQWNSLDRMRDMFLSILDVVYALVNRGKKTIKEWRCIPNVEDSIPLSFHIGAHMAASKINDGKATITPYMYYAFGFFFHKKLMDKLSQTAMMSTKLDYERTARFSFEYATDTIKNCDTYQEKDYTVSRKAFIDDWTSNYRATCRGNTATAGSREKNYKQLAHKLLSDKKIIARNYVVRRDPGEYEEALWHEPEEGSPEEISKKGPPASLVVCGIIDNEGMSEYSGNEPSFKHFTLFEAQSDGNERDNTEKKGRDGKKKTPQWSETTTNRNHLFAWDSRCINLFHFSFLYEYFETEWGNPEENAVILFLLMLMHTGIEPRELLYLAAYKAPGRRNMLELQMINGRYFILNPAIVRLQNKPEETSCLPVSDRVYVPIPEIVAKYIPQNPADGHYIFSYAETKGTAKTSRNITRLSFDHLERFLGKLNSKYAVNNQIEEAYRHGLKLTLKNIANGFFALYSTRYGLDPYIAAHISGRAHQEMLGAQLHYVHIPHELLEKEYLRTFDTCHRNIIENLRLCSKYNFTRTLVTEINKTAGKKPGQASVASFTLQHRGKQPPISNGDAPSCKPNILSTSTSNSSTLSLPGYGSSSIPSTSYITNIILELKKAISKERSDVIRRHNLYVVYLYLGTQFATTLRPHDDPKIFWQQYNSRAGMIVINDKDSKDYSEERILQLPRRIRNLLDEMYNDRQPLFSYVRDNLCRSFQRKKSESLFYTIDNQGIFSDLTFDFIRETLKSLGINYNVPMNMPRHFTRNYLYHYGISHDIGDMWMGHQRSGREAFNIVSSFRVQEGMALCLRAIDNMLDEIGFDEVRYLPLWLKKKQNSPLKLK